MSRSSNSSLKNELRSERADTTAGATLSSRVTDTVSISFDQDPAYTEKLIPPN